MTARAKALMPPIDKFDSEVERLFNSSGWMWLKVAFPDDDLAVMYSHPFTLNLMGEKYTPDFMAVMASGAVLIIEAKGSRKQGSYRDSRSKLRAAAAMYPVFYYYEVLVEVAHGAITNVTFERIQEAP